ncbi:hypothetical protein TSUD_266750 [Trifolium subterraneum]|uniref:Uncharacterized protein n=1 Tax=Trifolium subterraneum TaxID=3900 RepID=A0A2Z6M375_TRISU|nr:hypothetical protein TSUD_266750 [Trifolium subterraneum]
MQEPKFKENVSVREEDETGVWGIPDRSGKRGEGGGAWFSRAPRWKNRETETGFGWSYSISSAGCLAPAWKPQFCIFIFSALEQIQVEFISATATVRLRRCFRRRPVMSPLPFCQQPFFSKTDRSKKR